MSPLAGIVASLLYQTVTRALDRTQLPATAREAVRQGLDRVVEDGLDTAPIESTAKAAGRGTLKTRARPALVWSLVAQVGLMIAAGLLNAVAPETADAFITGVQRVMAMVEDHPTLSVVLGLTSGGYIAARTYEKRSGVD